MWLTAAKQLLALVQTSHRAHGSQSQAEAFAGIYASEILKINIQMKKSPCAPRACSHLKPVPNPRSPRFAQQFTPVRCCSIQGLPKRWDRGRSCCLPHSSAPGRPPPGTGATSAPDACTHWGPHAELCLVAVPNLGQCQAPKGSRAHGEASWGMSLDGGKTKSVPKGHGDSSGSCFLGINRPKQSSRTSPVAKGSQTFHACTQ